MDVTIVNTSGVTGKLITEVTNEVSLLRNYQLIVVINFSDFGTNISFCMNSVPTVFFFFFERWIDEHNEQGWNPLFCQDSYF